MFPWLHPTLVHFSIGLLLAGLLFDVLGLFRTSEKLIFAGFWNTLLGAIGALAAVGTGFLAEARLGPHSSIGNALLSFHKLFGIAVAVVAAGLAVSRIGMRGYIRPRARTLYLAAALFAAGLVSIAGGLGGTLVYWYGIGVSPETARRILEAQPDAPPRPHAPRPATTAVDPVVPPSTDEATADTHKP